ncbi:lymphocyte cytosolic protein 2 [Fundulus diaphanus]
MPEPQKPSKVLYRPTGGAVAVATGSLTSRRPPPVVPQRNVPNRANNQVARVPALIQHTRSDLSVRTSRQGLDPRWYRGRITRNQAEVSLWEVNKDGAFLVRDSSHSSTQHPYTLMLLKQGKIYNIKIQRQNDFYFLGNGVNNIKRFLGVKEMIVHHMNTPLLLIDATHQSSEEQCCLLHPAGL